MIKAEYSPNDSKLIIEGHAEQNIIGKDVICAGISTLTQTFACVCKSMDKAGWTTKPAKIAMENGRAVLQAYPRTHTCFVARCKLDGIAEGFVFMAENFPEYISFKIV